MANINSHIFFIFVNGRSALLKAAMVPHAGAAGRLVVAAASQRGGVNAPHLAYSPLPALSRHFMPPFPPRAPAIKWTAMCQLLPGSSLHRQKNALLPSHYMDHAGPNSFAFG
jgi:hypothetical protein